MNGTSRLPSLFICFALLVSIVALTSARDSKIRSDIPQKYDPTWASLDKRPIPSWYDEAKFGIFMHWGVYSVPSFGSEWFWWNLHQGNKAYVDFLKKNYPPGFKYADFAPMFHAEFFDPNEWADLLSKSGAK
jgi:alpha-L-fucosidase